MATQKALKEQIRNVIKRIGQCDSILTKHPNDYQFFLKIFERHPNYPEKFCNLKDIKIDYHPVFRNQLEVLIVREDGSFDDVSVLKKCVSGKNKDNLSVAMRNCIFPQIKEFRESQLILKCCICSNFYNIEIDHHEPDFVVLQNNFLKNEKNIPTKFDSDHCHIKKFTEQDKDFQDKWFLYHKENANLRVLCSKCNNSKPKSKRNIYKNI